MPKNVNTFFLSNIFKPRITGINRMTENEETVLTVGRLIQGGTRCRQRVGENAVRPPNICASGDSLVIVFGEPDPPW
jgi:hypothetical protein